MVDPAMGAQNTEEERRPEQTFGMASVISPAWVMSFRREPFRSPVHEVVPRWIMGLRHHPWLPAAYG